MQAEKQAFADEAYELITGTSGHILLRALRSGMNRRRLTRVSCAILHVYDDAGPMRELRGKACLIAGVHPSSVKKEKLWALPTVLVPSTKWSGETTVKLALAALYEVLYMDLGVKMTPRYFQSAFIDASCDPINGGFGVVCTEDCDCVFYLHVVGVSVSRWEGQQAERSAEVRSKLKGIAHLPSLEVPLYVDLDNCAGLVSRLMDGLHEDNAMRLRKGWYAPKWRLADS